MSYCRWSSDNFQCDLYVYEDVSGGYTTHVAANRLVGELPPDPLREFIAGRLAREELSAQYTIWRDALQVAGRERIGLPYDGQSFNDDTLEELRARLLMLRATGYRFPNYVLDEIEGELPVKEQ